MTTKLPIAFFVFIISVGLHAQQVFGTHITNAPGVRFREAPRLDAAVIGSLPEGTELIPLERASGNVEIGQWTGNWVKVRTRDHEGYLFSPFISQNPDTPSSIVQFGLLYENEFGMFYSQQNSNREYNRGNSSEIDRSLGGEYYDLIPDYFQSHPDWEGRYIRGSIERRFNFNEDFPWREEDGYAFMITGPQLPERIELEPDIHCRLSFNGEGHAESFTELQGERSDAWRQIETDFIPSIEEELNARASSYGFYPTTLYVQGVSLWSDQFFYITASWRDEPVNGENVLDEKELLLWDGFYRVHNGEFIYLGGQRSMRGDIEIDKTVVGFIDHRVKSIFDADGNGFPEFWMMSFGYSYSSDFWVFTSEDTTEASPSFNNFLTP